MTHPNYIFTAYHSKYFSTILTLQNSAISIDRLSQSIFNAQIDLNPHQVGAALFAFKSPISNGVILADEVGLGKTIESGLVMSQYWSERKRKIIIIAPASLRKQWSLERKEAKEKIKELSRQSKLTSDLAEQDKIQNQIKDQEKKRRTLQRDIFDIEDAIAQERDQIIVELRRAMKQKVHREHLLIIEWEII